MIITNDLSIIYSSSIVDFDLFVVPDNINNGFSYLNSLDLDLDIDLVIKPISIDTLLNNKKVIIELDENPVKKRKIEEEIIQPSSTPIINKKQKIDVRKINKYQDIFTIESCGLTIRYINIKGNLFFCALDVLGDVITYKENIYREVKYKLTLDEYCMISTNSRGKPTSFITYEAISKIINIRLEKKGSSYLKNNIDKVNKMLSELRNI